MKLFREALRDPGEFTVTLELVPGPESQGRSVDTVKAIAADAVKDGRVAAVSITDNPGGNPSLSPDALGREILDLGMDVIVHCTCRDLNRAGLESRALQLSRMGMRTILALTGDYSGRGFGGQGLPVFDLDSVTLTCLLHAVSQRAGANRRAHDGFSVGCAVSPFKRAEAETLAQYQKLRMKRRVGADFVMTQLGYDARKFQELLQMQRVLSIPLPALGTVFVLSVRAARYMNKGKVPGAVVTDELLARVEEESRGADHGHGAAIERAARLAAVLKGLGYRGIHLGGIHTNFDTVDSILTRLGEIGDRWEEFLPDFDLPLKDGFYVFERADDGPLSTDEFAPRTERCGPLDGAVYRGMQGVHDTFFSFSSPLAPALGKAAAALDKTSVGRALVHVVEDPAKFVLLRCKRCGDCAIQHVGFLCPESQCPKHMRNGACGGGMGGMCEVHPDRPCVWVRCYRRLASRGRADDMGQSCVPPRMWELNETSSWLNFHLRRDHQSLPCEIQQLFEPTSCPAESEESPD